MKSTYFTPHTIYIQAEDLLHTIGQKPKRQSWQRPALLVLDLQQYFFKPDSHAFVPSASSILPGLLKLIAAFQQANFPIIFTQHLNTPEDAGMMSAWWRELLTESNPLADLIPSLASYQPQALRKSQYDAFLHTDLDAMLSEEEVTDVVITGVMTHLCCETTARSAFMHGYHVWFPVDGSATYNLDYHMGTLRNLAHGFANLSLVSDLLNTLS